MVDINGSRISRIESLVFSVMGGKERKELIGKLTFNYMSFCTLIFLSKSGYKCRRQISKPRKKATWRKWQPVLWRPVLLSSRIIYWHFTVYLQIIVNFSIYILLFAWCSLMKAPQNVSYLQRSLVYSIQWKWKLLGPVRLFATQWTIQSMEFSRPEYWRG